jgi:outer membrane receptor protein involved in Fe transport
VGGLPSSAPINIPKASVTGLELKAGVRLTPLGIPNAQVTTRYQYRDSKVDDPFTHRERSIYDLWDREFSLGFRHDLTKARASYGATLLATGGVNTTSDIRTLQYLKRGPRLQLFAEKALPRDLTLRLEVYNLTGSHERSYRALYAVSQADGAISRTETYREVRDIRYVVRLRGKF